MVWLYTFLSVFIVSLISLIGVFTLSISQEKLEKILIYLVSLSAGTLLGDAFIHLIPEAYKEIQNKALPAVYILSGILAFFVLEKFIHWRHCHKIASPDHPHPFSYVILWGDMAHNVIDGMIIAASFLVSFPVGIATTLAVILHEIPHEIGNFGSLVYGGFSRGKALAFNFLTALTAFLGAFIVLIINTNISQITNFLISFAAGGFIYIASSDLIPELHKQTNPKKSLLQLVVFVIGIGLMLSLLYLE
ncbi:MAG: ZIP family metal transporter [Candidatus Moranbacteria bacterium]|nr:ZIP family metal transporter [Candidatus Moranbacteria bacterium]